MSFELATHRNLAVRPTLITIKVADVTNYGLIGRLQDVLVTFGDLTVHLYFLNGNNSPPGILIGTPVLDRMGAVMSFTRQFMDFSNECKIARAGLQPDLRLTFQQGSTPKSIFSPNIFLITKASVKKNAEERIMIAENNSFLPWKICIRFSRADTLLHPQMRKTSFRSSVLTNNVYHRPADIAQNINEML